MRIARAAVVAVPRDRCGDAQVSIAAAAIAGADQIALAPFLFAAVAAPAGVGAFVAWRRPGERVAWILLSARCRSAS